MAGRSDLAAQLERVRLESDTLYAIISAVGSSVDLTKVLDGIVELVTEATGCHACFVYLRDGDRLRIRAASRIYAHVVGKVEFALDEGLTGWVARTGEPAFIREDALSDPRMKYVPELEEEHFQSMVAVPMPARSGEVLGVVVLHTVAPREFDEGVLNFLVHTASLVAGAIENAGLYEETRLRVDALTNLAALSESIVAVDGREELYRVVTTGVRRLLGCDASQLWLRDGEDGPLELVAFDPPGALPDPHVESRAPLRDDRQEVGALVAVRSGVRTFPAQHQELLQAVANQAALALRNAEHIERLTAENLVRALFEALDDGALDIAEARARAAGCDLDRPHVFIHARPVATGEEPRPWPEVAERVETRLRTLEAGALVDPGRDALRGLLPLPARAQAGDVGALRELAASEGVAIGMSAVRSRRRGRPREPAPGPGRRRHRAGAHPGRRRPGLRGAGRVPLPRAPGARRRAARPALRGGGAAARLRRAPRDAAARHARAVPRRPPRRDHHGAQALHPRQHAAPAPGPHPEADRARPRDRGPAVARARGQARAPSARRRRRITTQILSAT